jgi:hypothetical protein
MRLDGLTQTGARAVLLALMAAIGALLAHGFGGASMLPALPAGMSDMDLYALTVERLRENMDYYRALGLGLSGGNFPTASVFNWRTPLYLSLMAWAPNALVLHLAIWLVALLAVGLAGAWAALQLGHIGLIAGCVLAAASLLGVPAQRAVFSFELAAGMLILIGFAAHGLKWHWPGFAALVLALFIRELAAVPVLVMLGFAWWHRRRVEALAGLLAIGAYGAHYAWHAQMVAQAVEGRGVPGPDWLYFGGLQFVLATAAFNGVFMLTPLWVSALVLPLGLLGLAHWRPGLPALVTVLVYLAIFAIGGRPFNAYWGALYMPLVTLGLAFAPAAMLTLARISSPARMSGGSRLGRGR